MLATTRTSIKQSLMQLGSSLALASLVSSIIPRIYCFAPQLPRFSLSHKRASFHSTTSCRLNRFLFRDEELLSEAMEDGIQTIKLAKDDYRTVHAAKILGLQNGDRLRAGILKTSPQNDSGGLVTDSALVEWIPENPIKRAQPTKNGEPPGSLKIHLCDLQLAPVSNAPPVSLILALPRPLQLGRMLPMIAQMGVDHLVLTEARKVPKDYFGSHLFRKSELLTEKIVQGLEQAGDVRMPRITIARNLSCFLKEELDQYFPPGEFARVIAHPTRIHDPKPAIRMRQCTFPNESMRKMVIAVGPEGGWEEPDELSLFQSRGFEQITMGTRVLRSDCAVVSLLSLAHDACYSID